MIRITYALDTLHDTTFYSWNFNLSSCFSITRYITVHNKTVMTTDLPPFSQDCLNNIYLSVLDHLITTRITVDDSKCNKTIWLCTSILDAENTENWMSLWSEVVFSTQIRPVPAHTASTLCTFVYHDFFLHTGHFSQAAGTFFCPPNLA